jgi:preprotein translocase subunit SecF
VNYKLDFVRRRKWFYLISGALLLLGLVSFLVQGLNLGIDFKSGTRVDVRIGHPYDLAEAKKVLTGLGYKDANVRAAGNNKEVLVFRTNEVLSPDKVAKIRTAFQQKYGKNVDIQEQKVDPIIGQELVRNAIISVAIASIGIILYLTIRFEYRFAVSAVVALLHDVLIVIGLFSLFQWEVDLVFVAAILTIVGYSVNDTIVIFDRIRENVELHKPKKFEELARVVNESIHQTLVRSINTVLTVVFGASTLLLFGGESIFYFSLALLLGLLFGAYSSIFIASQIWLDWKWRSMNRAKPASE